MIGTKLKIKCVLEGFEENTLFELVDKYGRITSSECKELLKLERTRVGDILTALVNKKALFRHGNSRLTYYGLIDE